MESSEDPVRIDLDDILARVEANGYDDVRVEFAPDAVPRVPLIEVMGRGVEAANAGEPPTIWGEDPSPTAVGAAMRLKHLVSQDALVSWLTTFAGVLAEAGLTGVLRAAPPTRRP
ncbi:MAG TPA: hypothetical protein VJT31_34970 [Rugosimonospora sp.]|nr:hypothetical protein [Rugosimonospora sp.]